ncbi:hypothetical protein ES705_04974 [subsurface metagenome]
MEYLVKFNAMNRAIQEAHGIDEVKLIRDKAEAIRYALIQAKASPEYVRMAEEIKLRAERRAGELLPEQIIIGTRSHPTTLSDIKISKDQSSKWQRINSIPENKFEEYINTKKEITTSGAVKLARKLQRESEFEGTPELPGGKYNLLYADPPWKYGDTLVEGYGSVERHYTPMTIQELCDLDIKNIVADNAVLFLWVTSPLLEECFSVIKAWGFKYKASFIWDKVKHNWGHYNSVRHEFLLICIKGTFLPQSKELHDSVISIERSKEHSGKPEYFRNEVIEKMYPRGKWIELFARYDKEKKEKLEEKGWTFWGAQA